MPKSKPHYRRKMKLRKRNDKFESLISKRLATFNQLPEEEKVALLTRWKNRDKTEEESDAPRGEATDG